MTLLSSHSVLKSNDLNCAFTQLHEPESMHHVLGRVNYQHHSERPCIRNGIVHTGIHMISPEIEPFSEIWFSHRPVQTGTAGPLTFAEDGEYLFCVARVDEQDVYRESVQSAYESAFELIHQLGYRTIFRMWNLVGGITANNAEGLENYRDFCMGRAEAFERWTHEIGSVPAATGIGALSGGVDFYFLACRQGAATHVENPLQTPAYQYPNQYGPKPPSFARATYLRPTAVNTDNVLFVSGTASIIGEKTAQLDNITGQVELTIGNIEAVISRGNLWRHGIDDGYRITDLDFIKVYVRDRRHMPVVKATCAEMFNANARIAYVVTDICRSDLLVEIEGSCWQRQ